MPSSIPRVPPWSASVRGFVQTLAYTQEESSRRCVLVEAGLAFCRKWIREAAKRALGSLGIDLKPGSLSLRCRSLTWSLHFEPHIRYKSVTPLNSSLDPRWPLQNPPLVAGSRSSTPSDSRKTAY